MNKESKETTASREQLLILYYNYIGSLHVENIIHEQDRRKTEINKTPLSPHMDSWFGALLQTHNNQERIKYFKRKVKQFTPKVAIFFMLILVAGTVLSISVEGVRVRVLNIVLETKDRFSNIQIKESNENTNSLNIKKWKEYYYPNYLPEGFFLESIESVNDMKIINFSNEVNKSILFVQAPNGSSLQLDTEDAQCEEITVQGVKALYIEKEQKRTLFWHNSEYSFYIVSEIPIEEIINMAENMEKK